MPQHSSRIRIGQDSIRQQSRPDGGRYAVTDGDEAGPDGVVGVDMS